MRPGVGLFTFRQLPTVFAMLAERGIPADQVLHDAQLSVDHTAHEVTAPLATVHRFLELAAWRLDAPLLGLDIADRIPLGAYGVTEFVIRAAPTIRDALEALCELAPLVNPLVEMRYVADQIGCELHFSVAGAKDALGRILNEYTVGYVSKQFGVVLAQRLPLARAWFAHDRKEARADLAARLGCPITFRAADCGFAVASDVVSHAVPDANRPLFEFLITQARAQLANLGTRNSAALVTRAIESRISSIDLGAETIAQALGMSRRSLHRELADAGTSYREVLHRVRLRRHAELVRAGLTEADIAARLGFSSAKTMRRSLDDRG